MRESLPVLQQSILALNQMLPKRLIHITFALRQYLEMLERKKWTK